MSIVQPEEYTGYVTTSFIREKAGYKLRADIYDKEINTCIKAAEDYINDELDLVWTPYAGGTEAPPNRIKEVAKLLSIALLRSIYPDELDTYQKNWDLGLALLKQFKSTNTTAQTGGTGQVILSPYNSDTNNPDKDPYLTTNNFSRDYIPTFRN